MSSEDMAKSIAWCLQDASGERVRIAPEDILARCRSTEELAWWYAMLAKK